MSFYCAKIKTLIEDEYPDGSKRFQKQEPRHLVCPQQIPKTREPKVNEKPWNVFEETDPNMETIFNEIKDKALSEGICVQAPPGSGKSTLCQRLVKLAKERGMRVQETAPTHVACRVLSPESITLARY